MKKATVKIIKEYATKHATYEEIQGMKDILSIIHMEECNKTMDELVLELHKIQKAKKA